MGYARLPLAMRRRICEPRANLNEGDERFIPSSEEGRDDPGRLNRILTLGISRAKAGVSLG